MSSTVATAPEKAAQKDRQVAKPRRRLPTPYLLLIPSVVILLIGMGYPLIWQTITSFQKFGLSQQFGQPAPFVGFENYLSLATNPDMWGVVVRSLVFMAVTAFITLAIGLLLAVLMTAVGKVVRLTLQISLLLAWAMPVVAAMTVWIWLFDRRRGVVNYLLDMIPGVEMNRFAWLENPFTFFMVACIIVVWMSVPFVAFSVYAGLTQVSDEVLEAAQLDGASAWQRLSFIIMPMIRPVIAIVLLLQLIWDLRVFTQITMLQDAGSRAAEFDLLGTYIYKLGAGSQDFGMASAVSIFVLLLTVAISWYYVRSLLKEDEQS
ncbi:MULTISPECIES: carbohydrate ABC transporter permease [Microterricola]|uniref:Carbohydrate ABC transporter membrane protein 1, CUT1 family n=2 Tax=Microterricola TaxID=518733 RepID=A0A1H1QHW1_9MICO|nr:MULTISPECIES: sugar ABC transporter permease [Microterricola]PPL15998.1 sugar ABC transporter permease [Microterricola pindariensis]SDS23072.1 carbohydrate ABC transporter membrane protein 1, CUT1 family [Microterricola viridarii]